MEDRERLSGLCPGEWGKVTDLTAVGAMRRRLLDIGLVQGAIVDCIGRSPAGDPTAYRICGATVAIRRRDADSVEIVRLGNGQK